MVSGGRGSREVRGDVAPGDGEVAQYAMLLRLASRAIHVRAQPSRIIDTDEADPARRRVQQRLLCAVCAAPPKGNVYSAPYRREGARFFGGEGAGGGGEEKALGPREGCERLWRSRSKQSHAEQMVSEGRRGHGMGRLGRSWEM